MPSTREILNPINRSARKKVYHRLRPISIASSPVSNTHKWRTIGPTLSGVRKYNIFRVRGGAEESRFPIFDWQIIIHKCWPLPFDSVALTAGPVRGLEAPQKHPWTLRRYLRIFFLVAFHAALFIARNALPTLTRASFSLARKKKGGKARAGHLQKLTLMRGQRKKRWRIIDTNFPSL